MIQWRTAIEGFKRNFNKEIFRELRISFDGLEEKEKNIFLDIACFFNGEKKDFVMKVLDGWEFFPDIGIYVLIKRSLIKVDQHSKYLRMHNLLQEMGRKIVEEECFNEPGKRSRLWNESDVHHILTKNTGTEMIESMIIDNKRESSEIFNLSVDTFSKMKRLRLLKVLCASNCEDLKYLSNELRLLDWKGCPLRSLPSSFQPDNLVALLLPYSRIEQLWKGNRPLYKLKIINLEGSQNLIKTPDLTTASRLEVLILEGCTRLVDVHPSVGVLKSLKLLNLKDCISLKSLPTIIGMESLETLILSGCSSLVRFPGIDRKMERLKTLDISGCYRVEILPGNLQSFNGCERASKLQRIALSLFKLIRKGWTNSKAPMLPSLPGLSSLRKLKLRDCNLRERDIPRDFSCLLARKAKGRHKTTHQAGSHEQGETSLRVSVDDIPQREYTEEEEEKEDKIDEDTPSPQYYNFDEAFVPKRPSTKGVVLRSPTRGKRPRQSSGRVYRRVAGKKHKGKKVVESESESDEDF